MSDELKPLIKDALKFVFEAAGEELAINGLCAQDICYQIAETGRIDMDNIHSPDDFVDEFISSLKTRPLCPDTPKATVIETLNSNNMVRSIMRYGGWCRDCANECGLCPYTQLPCETENKETAIKSVIDAITYYLKNSQYLKGEL